MDLKLLEKQFEIFKQIKALEDEISKLNEFAETIAGSDFAYKVELNFSKRHKQGSASLGDIRESMIEMQQALRESLEQAFYAGPIGIQVKTYSPKKICDSFADILLETETLELLGALLSIKNTKRNKLLSDLADLQKSSL